MGRNGSRTHPFPKKASRVLKSQLEASEDEEYEVRVDVPTSITNEKLEIFKTNFEAEEMFAKDVEDLESLNGKTAESRKREVETWKREETVEEQNAKVMKVCRSKRMSAFKEAEKLETLTASTRKMIEDLQLKKIAALEADKAEKITLLKVYMGASAKMNVTSSH
ncbi:hypothetical protein R1sor_014808 [Riccia sorocarpa]|uniref:DUF4200 domain-containing protein n=1 Tax=Riccia sorocarpa TaxID=122646 RepID=A0ABD3HDA7_9MARC